MSRKLNDKLANTAKPTNQSVCQGITYDIHDIEKYVVRVRN